jgi:hypothetical protein
VREVVLHHLEPQAAVGVEGQVLHLERQAVDEVEEGLRVRGGGVSDVNSNPPEDGAVDDIFPLNLAMPPIVEWSLHMISVLLDSIDSNDGPLGVCVRTIDVHLGFESPSSLAPVVEDASSEDDDDGDDNLVKLPIVGVLRWDIQ